MEGQKVKKILINGRYSWTPAHLFGYGEDSFFSNLSFRRDRVTDSGIQINSSNSYILRFNLMLKTLFL